MAKFTMKDYENAMLEEARQDQLQEELEARREFESSGSDIDWYIWQQEQKEKAEEELYSDYEDDDLYYQGEYDPDYGLFDDLLDLDVPCDTDTTLTAEDLYDMYTESFVAEDGYYPEEDDFMEAIDPFSDNPSELIAQESDLAISLMILGRKSIARNRHHTSEKAKRKSKQSAYILLRKYANSTVSTSYEEFRLYSRSTAANKKVARVKTA